MTADDARTFPQVAARHADLSCASTSGEVLERARQAVLGELLHAEITETAHSMEIAELLASLVVNSMRCYAAMWLREAADTELADPYDRRALYARADEIEAR